MTSNEVLFLNRDVRELKEKLKEAVKHSSELAQRNNFLARIMRENSLHEAKCDGWGRANAPEDRRFFYSDKPCNCWLSIDLDLKD